MGGRTAYSIRHKTRAKLVRDLQTALTTRRMRGKITLEENRGKDVVLWSRGREAYQPVNEATDKVAPSYVSRNPQAVAWTWRDWQTL